MLHNAEVQSLRALTLDGRLLFSTRIVRMFAYGMLSVILALYLVEVVGAQQVGTLLSLTLLGDAAISLWITTTADRLGRRRMLIVGAILMIVAGMAFALSTSLMVLLIAAIVGTISPSGNEVGPFLSIEQAALSHITEDSKRTSIFAWYNLVGSLATAMGALVGGALAQGLRSAGYHRSTAIGWCSSFMRCSARCSLSYFPGCLAARNRSCFASRRLPIGLGCIAHGMWCSAVGPVHAGCVRWGAGGSEFSRLLVLPPFWDRGSGAGRHFLRRERPCRAIGAGRRAHGESLRANQHDGVYASSIEHPAHSRPADAQSGSCYSGA